MKKTYIKPFDYAKEITSSLNGGILLTTKNGEKTNSMTIGWGMLGCIWNETYFITYVRTGRFTREMLDATREFTINVPYGNFDKKILGYCGSRSGRSTNKHKDLNLTLIDGEEVNVPAIKELPLTLECKVDYAKLMDKNEIPDDIRKKMYPDGVDSSHSGSNEDYHVAYYGKIVKAYILEEN